MNRTSAVLAAALFACVAGTSAFAQSASAKPPPWAYPNLGTTAPPAVVDDGVPRQLPGSALRVTQAQLFDLFTAHDWYPEMHPPMPDVVRQGRKPEVRACGMCHMPNGLGRPENASLAGLPADYIAQQVADWKAGTRRSADMSIGPQIRMTATAVHASEEEVQIAARYFASLPYTPWVRVVEADTVPKTQVVTGSMWAAVAGANAGTEPIGARVVEIPEDLHRTELRDPKSGFVAYVPPGSVRKGEQIATQGKGAVLACVTCHGPELKGLGAIPPLAGRSPQYLVRQLFDFQQGTRQGAQSQPMRELTRQMTLDDMIAAAAYAASRKP